VKKVVRIAHCGVLAALAATSKPVFAQCAYSIQIVQAPPICIPGVPPPTIGRDLNSLGHVVGYRFDCEISGADHAFLWTPEAGFQTLPKPPGTFAMFATGISDTGLIVGYSIITSVGNRGWVYDMHNPDAGFTYLEPLHGVGGSSLSAINNSGIAVGSRSIGKPGQL
jgi:hypothetical protein